MQRIIFVLILVVAIFSLSEAGGDRKGGRGRGKDKCKNFKEKDVTKMVSKWLADFQEKYNDNDIESLQTRTDDVRLMFNNAPTVFGNEAGTANLQFLRDNVFDRIEITVVKAVQMSCTRLYHVESGKGFKNGQLVSEHIRFLIIWKKVNGKWLRDVLMNNAGA